MINVCTRIKGKLAVFQVESDSIEDAIQVVKQETQGVRQGAVLAVVK